MSVLPETAFLAHLAACVALHPVAGNVPQADALRVAAVESAMWPLAIGINADRRRGLPPESHRPTSVSEAQAIVRRALAEGRRVDVGVMQVTDSNWQAYGLSLDTIFDPGANICAGLRILGEAFEAELTRVRRAAFCRYNTGRPDCSNGYAEKVMARTPRPAPPAPPPQPEPVTAPEEPLPFDLFERARVLRERRLQRERAPDPAPAPEAPAAATSSLASATTP